MPIHVIVRGCTIAAALLVASPLTAPAEQSPPTKVVEIRSYKETLRGLTQSGGTAMKNDMVELAALNEDYIRSVQHSDVKRFGEILSDDFLCSNPDGSLIDRAQFLRQTAVPVTISNLKAHDVNVRLMGDVAIIHARTTYTLADGRAGSGRYTDVWARRGGKWLAVSAHVTRN